MYIIIFKCSRFTKTSGLVLVLVQVKYPSRAACKGALSMKLMAHFGPHKRECHHEEPVRVVWQTLCKLCRPLTPPKMGAL